MNTNDKLIELQPGDIIMDMTLSPAGHAMIVGSVKNNNRQNRKIIILSHLNGYENPSIHRWSGYAPFRVNQSNNFVPDKLRYVIRWLGPLYAFHNKEKKVKSIMDELFNIIKIIHLYKAHGHNLSYSKMHGISMLCSKMTSHTKCFNKNRKISVDPIDKIINNEVFVCSSYVTMLWKYVLEQFLIPDEVLSKPDVYKFNNKDLGPESTLDEIALRMDPYECLPDDMMSLEKLFPGFWQIIPYTTSKIEQIEMVNLSKLPSKSFKGGRTKKKKNRNTKRRVTYSKK